MANEPFIRTEFKLKATFKHRKGGETVFEDIVAMSATFALNTIPTCSLEVASGLEVRTSKRATIHDIIDKLQPRDRAIVELTIKSTEGRREAPIINGLKDGTYIVFDGYYAGIGYQRSHNQCTYNIQLIHWLDDLNCSSMLNGDWSPGTPQDLAQVASSLVVADLTGGGGTSPDPGQRPTGGPGARATPMIDYQYPEIVEGDEIVVTGLNMAEDLWEKVIKRIFKTICTFQHPNTQCDGGESADVEDPPNWEADSPPDPGLVPKSANHAAWIALSRMPGKVPPKYRAKLPLELEGFLDDIDPHAFLSLSAHDGLSRLILDGMAYNSFWSKLVGDLAPSFLFAISPSVDYAQAIPFFPALSKNGLTPYVTITGEEYNYANFNTNCANMVSSIVIHWAPQGDGAQSNAGGEVEPHVGYCDPIGLYPKKKQDYKEHWGNILVRDPPAWLANPVYTALFTKDNQLNAMNGSTLAPQEGNETNPDAEWSHRKVEKHYREKVVSFDESRLNVYDRFACHWYKSAILGQRYGELSGKLRFDIAPGSIIRVNPPASAVGKEATPMHGAVVQVSFAINAEQHTAGTSFSLSHVRTDKENDINDPVSKIHFVGSRAPIYKDNPSDGSPWPGGPLVTGQEPDRTGDIDDDPPEFLAPGTFMV